MSDDGGGGSDEGQSLFGLERPQTEIIQRYDQYPIPWGLLDYARNFPIESQGYRDPESGELLIPYREIDPNVRDGTFVPDYGSAGPGAGYAYPGTADDQALRARLLAVTAPGGNTESGSVGGLTPYQQLLNDVVYGSLHPGGRQYTDPELVRWANNLIEQATWTDKFSFFGDNLFPALSLFGIAAGGAALSAPAATGSTGTAAAAPALSAVTPEITAPFAGTVLEAGAPFVSTAASGAGAGVLAPAAFEGAAPLATTAAGTGAQGSSNIFEQLRNLSNTQIGDTGVTYGQVYRGLSLANNAANVARNPSGGGVGSLVGGLLTAATGIPGGALVGRVAGSAYDNAASGGEGGSPVGETSQIPTDANGQIDWRALLRLLPGLAGLVGSGIGLSSDITASGRTEDRYKQEQQLYQLLTSLAQQYQQQLDAANTQNQSNVQTFNQRVGDVEAQRAQVSQGRTAVANRNLDPAQVAAGANALYQPLTAATQDDILRGVQRDLAMRGQSDGGAASRAAADALLRYIPGLRQNSVQNYLSSQGLGLNALQYAPGALQLAELQPRSTVQGFPSPPSYIPGAPNGQVSPAGGVNSLGKQLENLVQLLGIKRPNASDGTRSGGSGGGFGGGVSSEEEATRTLDQLRSQYPEYIYNDSSYDFLNDATFNNAPSTFDPSAYNDLFGSDAFVF